MARGLLVWLLIMLVETVHGVLRGLLLVPRVGEEAAARIGWPIGLALVLLVSILTIRWTRVEGPRGLLAMGALWAILTIAFEIIIGLMRGHGGLPLSADGNHTLQRGGHAVRTAGGRQAPALALRLTGPGRRRFCHRREASGCGCRTFW